jgi:hypothetical protein
MKNEVDEIHLFIFVIQTAGLEMDINRGEKIDLNKDRCHWI